jgi:transposase
VFLDEVGFSFLAKPASTWAPIGHPTLLYRVSERRVLSTMIFLTLSGKLYRCHFPHAIKGDDVIIDLEHLRRYLPGRKVLIWDHLSAHRDGAVENYLQAHPEIEVEWLPTYAPELNPEEGCNSNIKEHLANACPPNVTIMRQQVDREIARLRRRPDILNAFFTHAGLTVT